MKRDDFLVLADAMVVDVRKSLVGKGEAYSGTADAFENFKRNGERLGLTKYQIHMVYMNKHLDAINGAIRASPRRPIEKTEGMKGRILDAIAGMPVKEPLRVLIIQAENDKGEMSEHLTGVSDGMNLNGEERTQVKRMLKVVPDRTSSGSSFVQRLERLVRKYRADVVFCDPLVSYVGGDVNKMDVMAAFLRNGGINDVLERTNAMLFWIHHTGKPARGSEKNAETNMSIGDYSYIGLGSSDLTNWARAIMVIREVGNHGTDEIADEERLFELILPKRGKRAGFCDINGQQVNSKLYLKHAAGRICWELAEAPREQEEGDGPSNAQRIVEASFTVTDLEIQTRYNTFIEQGNSPALAAYNCSIDYREDYPIVRTAEIWRRLNPVNPTRGIQGRVTQLAQFLMRRDHIEAVQAIAISGGEWDATAPTISAALLTIAPQ